jgi:hypothetical protein
MVRKVDVDFLDEGWIRLRTSARSALILDTAAFTTAAP